MRTLSIAICLVLCAGTGAMAQERGPLGVKGGVNLANVTFDVEQADVNFDRRTGLVAGVFVVWPPDAPVALQLEALYSQKGAKFDADGNTITFELDYLEIPILARYSTPASSGPSLYVFGGPSLGFRLRAEGSALIDGEGEDGDISDEVERLDLGLAAGAGVEFGRMLVEGRYTWGLRALNKEDTDEVTVKNRVFSVMVGVRF